jgi:hypothetical protein
MPLDRSDVADAKRFRWLLSGNGYFMEEEMICGHAPTDDAERDKAREKIDEAMRLSTNIKS